ARTNRCARVLDHRAAMTRIVLLEREPCRRESGARPPRTRRMLTDESLQVLIGRGAIAARLLQLGEREECVVGVWRERILDDHAAIVSLGIRGPFRQRAAPEQRITVGRCSLRCRSQQRIHDGTTARTVPLTYEPACPAEDRVGGGDRWRRRAG